MGTRSTVKFFDKDSKKPLLSVYQQYDGYITGVGHELANWLKHKKMVNGFGLSDSMENGVANGMGCLAAQYVAQNKTEIGGFYCTESNDSQEFNYEVRYIDEQFQITVNKNKFTPDELLKQVD